MTIGRALYKGKTSLCLYNLWDGKSLSRPSIEWGKILFQALACLTAAAAFWWLWLTYGRGNSAIFAVTILLSMIVVGMGITLAHESLMGYRRLRRHLADVKRLKKIFSSDFSRSFDVVNMTREDLQKAADKLLINAARMLKRGMDDSFKFSDLRYYEDFVSPHDLLSVFSLTQRISYYFEIVNRPGGGDTDFPNDEGELGGKVKGETGGGAEEELTDADVIVSK